MKIANPTANAAAEAVREIKKLRPAVEKSPDAAIRVFSDHILSAGVGTHRRQLSVSERAGKRQQAGDNPNQ